MGKAKPHPGQLGFCFQAPAMPTAPSALAGLERQICATVGTILASDSRPREIIAAEMSILLGEDVSRAMLDAYSSPAREDHRVPMSRFLALVAVTARQDLMDPLMRQIGAALLVGEEVQTARIGQIDRQIDQLRAELNTLKRTAPAIRGK